MFKKIIKYFFNFIKYIFQFNILIAFKLFIVPVFTLNEPKYSRFAYKHKVIINYLKRKFSRTINIFKHKNNIVNSSFSDKYPVWTIWWQGEENMPPIISKCYQTLKYFSNNHNVTLITKDNYMNYISLPKHIIKKARKNILSITHLSDIIRICLLYEYGGLWLDSTVLLTKPLPDLPNICSHLGFWTPKDNGEILETCFGAKNWIIREGRWLTFCLFMSKNNILAEYVRDLFFNYVKKYNVFIDYFLFDYLISIAYDTNQDIRVMIDSVPANNPKIHEILHRLNLNYEYNKTLFDEICEINDFHKLNWKEEFSEFTKDNKLTNYGYIINNFPPK